MTIHRPTSSYYMVYRMQCIYGYVDIDMFIINALLNLLPVVCSYCSSLLLADKRIRKSLFFPLSSPP